MKNQPLLLLLLLAAAGCTATRQSSAPKNKAANTAARTTVSHSSPVIVNHAPNRQSSVDSSFNSMTSTSSAYATGVAITAMGIPLPIQAKYAILLNVPIEEITDTRMFYFIESWYGTRYKYGGADKTGIDCSAFVQSFMDNIYSILLPRTSLEQYHQSKRVKKTDLQEGDLVFFKTRGHRAGITHVGVYLRNNKFLHASTTGGVMIDDLDEAYYAGRYAGAGRVR